MATSGRGSGIVGYNVQVAVDTEHHLIITHEVTNVGSDRAQLARVAKEVKATLERANLDVIADRGYFSSEEILKCEQAGITVTLPKPMTSSPMRFGKQDFRYQAEEDVYICPAGERLIRSFTTEEHGLVLHRYLTNVCQSVTLGIAVPQPRSNGSRDGSTSKFSKPFSAGSTSIPRRCASAAKRSSIHLER
jgi:hypothetical protein